MLTAVIGLLVASVVLLVVWRLLRALALVVVVVVVLAGLVVGFADHHLHARHGTTAIAAVGHSVSRDVARLTR